MHINYRLFRQVKYSLAIISMGLLLATHSISVLAQSESDDASVALQDDTAEVNDSTDISFESIVPFAQYVEYVYNGDGNHYQSQSMIMEFAPDANGTFQTVSMSDSETIASVYQINEHGLYKLATFPDYTTVEDLRYSEKVADGDTSLILPRDLSIGLTFQSGPNNQSSITVQDVIDVLDMNGITYYDVVKLSEIRQTESDTLSFNHYLAPDYGVIAVELLNPDGSISTVYQQVKVDGYIGH